MIFSILATVCIFIVGFLLFLIFFEPSLRYAAKQPACPIDSDEFLWILGAAADTQLRTAWEIEVLTEGSIFYEDELRAIEQAGRSVHIEAFLFTPSAVTRRFVEALTERAKAGVNVRVVLDYVGSFFCPQSYFADLRKAGGVVAWYQPFRWYTFKRLNNRTHRELIIIDGMVGFIGGAGIAGHWSVGDNNGLPPWRDMMCRVRGDLVIGLQTTFAENWLEATGEILDMSAEFPQYNFDPPPVAAAESGGGTLRGLVVSSAPSAGRATRARILFQMLLVSAKKTIHINSPYFLPDRSARNVMIKAARERGVKIRVITPGDANNHPATRRASRRVYGELLRAGIEIHEYQPGMIHKKALVIDDIWSVVGSTNFDTRSFGLNDEVNLAVLDAEVARKLQEQFAIELAHSRPITYEHWQQRPRWERILSFLGWIMERQE